MAAANCSLVRLADFLSQCSKFFSAPNGSKPPPQQTKLSFATKASAKPKKPAAAEDEVGPEATSASSESAQVDETKDADVKVEAIAEKGMKGRPDL